MLDRLLSFIAPHLCYGCGKTGSLLCDNCKYDIISQDFTSCVSCGRVSLVGVCPECNVPYSKAWCVGERSGVLEELINGYKFHNAYDAHRCLVELLDATIPQLPRETIILPVPTVSSHIRERGYDHALLIASRLAQRRNCKLGQYIERRADSRQRGASRRQRIKQAKEAFIVKKALNPDIPYLLVDDVTTTGATLRYAVEALRHAGAETIWVAVVARQPLD